MVVGGGGQDLRGARGRVRGDVAVALQLTVAGVQHGDADPVIGVFADDPLDLGGEVDGGGGRLRLAAAGAACGWLCWRLTSVKARSGEDPLRRMPETTTAASTSARAARRTPAFLRWWARPAGCPVSSCAWAFLAGGGATSWCSRFDVRRGRGRSPRSARAPRKSCRIPMSVPDLPPARGVPLLRWHP